MGKENGCIYPHTAVVIPALGLRPTFGSDGCDRQPSVLSECYRNFRPRRMQVLICAHPPKMDRVEPHICHGITAQKARRVSGDTSNDMVQATCGLYPCWVPCHSCSYGTVVVRSLPPLTADVQHTRIMVEKPASAKMAVHVSHCTRRWPGRWQHIQLPPACYLLLSVAQ